MEKFGKRNQRGFALLPYLILSLVLTLGIADSIHSSAHGKNKPPPDYYDPHEAVRP